MLQSLELQSWTRLSEQQVSLGQTCATPGWGGGPLMARKVWHPAPAIQQDLSQESRDVGPSSCKLRQVDCQPLSTTLSVNWTSSGWGGLRGSDSKMHRKHTVGDQQFHTILVLVSIFDSSQGILVQLTEGGVSG